MRRAACGVRRRSSSEHPVQRPARPCPAGRDFRRSRSLLACIPSPYPGRPRPLPRRYNDESIIITQADIDGSGFVDAVEVGRWLQAMRKAGKIRDERLTAEELIKRYDKGGKVGVPPPQCDFQRLREMLALVFS